MHVHRADAQLSVARLWAPRAFSAHMHDAYAEPEALTGGCVWREVCLTGIGTTFLSKPFRCRTERLYRLILTFELMHRANSHCSVSFPFDRPLCTACLSLPPRPCCRPPPSSPLAHEAAVFGSCRSTRQLVNVNVNVNNVCTRQLQPPSASTLASLLPVGSYVRSWLLRLLSSFVSAPAHLPAPAPVLRKSTPASVRRGASAVADARLGLA